MAMKSEIVDAMDGLDAGSPPAVFTQSGTVSQMDACGCRWPEANFDIDKMIELALQMSRQYGFDTVRIPFDITAEAEGLGATVLLIPPITSVAAAARRDEIILAPRRHHFYHLRRCRCRC